MDMIATGAHRKTRKTKYLKILFPCASVAIK
jgi:hypothetical protein